MLKKKGLSLLFKTMQEPSDSKLRKKAAKLLCALAYNNEESQKYICSQSNFNQLTDKICINPVPEIIKEKIKQNPALLREIKEVKSNTKGCFYWSYPIYNGTDFPDPLYYLIGFYSYGADCLPKRRRKSFKSCDSHSTENSSSTKRYSRPLSIQTRQRETRDYNKTLSSVINNSKDMNNSNKCLESVLEEGIKVPLKLSGAKPLFQKKRGSGLDSKIKIKQEKFSKTQKLTKLNMKLPKSALNTTQVISSNNKTRIKSNKIEILNKERRSYKTIKHTSKAISMDANNSSKH